MSPTKEDKEETQSSPAVPESEPQAESTETSTPIAADDSKSDDQASTGPAALEESPLSDSDDDEFMEFAWKGKGGIAPPVQGALSEKKRPAK